MNERPDTLADVIAAALDLADSVQPGLAKHAPPPPVESAPTGPEHGNAPGTHSKLETLAGWLLDMFDAIETAAGGTRRRLYELAEGIAAGDDLAIETADAIAAELAPEFEEVDQ